jgi:organic radical activating enzyme
MQLLRKVKGVYLDRLLWRFRGAREVRQGVPQPVRIQPSEFTAGTMHVTWALTNKCTYKCRYCPDELHIGKKDEYSREDAMRFLDELFARYPKLNFVFSGGEPTIADHFDEIIDRIYERGHSMGMTSNGRRTLDYWSKTAGKFNYICMSYHPASEKSDEAFFDRVDEVSKHTFCMVRVMMDPNHWDQCIGLLKLAETRLTKGRLEVVKVLDDFGGWKYCDVSYTPEQLRFLAEFVPIDRLTVYPKPVAVLQADALFSDGSVERSIDGNAWVSRGLTNFKSWTCNIGLESLLVDRRGRVFRGNCQLGGELGTLSTSIRWPKKALVCSKTRCHCVTDILVTKHSGRAQL